MAVKRLLISAILALGVHIALLGTQFDRFRKIPAAHFKSRVLSVSLSMQHRPKSTKAVQTIPPETLPKRTKRLKPLPKAPEKQLPKPKPRAVQPTKKEMSAIVNPAPLTTESETKNPHEPFESAKQNGKDIATPLAIQKVRPFYRSNPRPKYPRAARARGYQGNVVLEVLVDQNGRVSDLRVFKSSGYPILDQAAEEAVKKWLFEPAMIGKEKVKMWVRIPIRFELE